MLVTYQAGGCDVLMLTWFSMARAMSRVVETVDRPVLTSPTSAVAKLKRLFGE